MPKVAITTITMTIKKYIYIDRDYISVNSISNQNFLDIYNASFQSITDLVENHNRTYVENGNADSLTVKNYYSEVNLTTTISANLLN